MSKPASITTELFSCIPESLLQDRRATDKAIRLYGILYMLIFREPSRVIQATHKSLSEITGWSVSTVKDAVTSLKDTGALITWVSDGYNGNFYRLQGVDGMTPTPQPPRQLPPSRDSGYNSIIKELENNSSLAAVPSEGTVVFSSPGGSDSLISEEEAKALWDEYDEKRWFTSPLTGASVRRKPPSDFGVPDLRSESPETPLESS